MAGGPLHGWRPVQPPFFQAFRVWECRVAWIAAGVHALFLAVDAVVAAPLLWGQCVAWTRPGETTTPGQCREAVWTNQTLADFLTDTLVFDGFVVLATGAVLLAAYRTQVATSWLAAAAILTVPWIIGPPHYVFFYFAQVPLFATASILVIRTHPKLKAWTPD